MLLEIKYYCNKHSEPFPTYLVFLVSTGILRGSLATPAVGNLPACVKNAGIAGGSPASGCSLPPGSSVKTPN